MADFDRAARLVDWISSQQELCGGEVFGLDADVTYDIVGGDRRIAGLTEAGALADWASAIEPPKVAQELEIPRPVVIAGAGRIAVHQEIKSAMAPSGIGKTDRPARD